ncbi:1-phosphatidylinositol 4,5-bisphosphate phosphodiesterase gamma-1 isoform X2 [Cimex lectularius]|uniref:Phosphoinositide phospholipase C n=1 Tax=Cimex lectularius TaxID=79782 RepID=A0A8I6RAB3_CIMLE|nr:1-phosphatidylinositol 4,5-bisphosphate phosphodiesterase gamma-1 isoform X2 [Cimex lectularius]
MANGTMGSFAPEIEQIISQLERGTIVTRFFPRKRPEKKMLMIRRETRQIAWARNSTTKAYDGTIEMREVKLIRIGKCSKDFDRWPEDAKRMDHQRCFVVSYGSEFKLKTLSIAAFSEKECEIWVRGLKCLVDDTIAAPYPLQVERWLRKEFYAMENIRETVTLKDIKAFLPRVNCKIGTNKLREIFQDVDIRKREELTFDDFAKLYHKIMFDETTFKDILEQYSSVVNEEKIVTVKDLTRFLVTEQGDSVDGKEVSKHMREYLQDTLRNVHEPYFTQVEFLDFLFSKQNDLWNYHLNEVSDDMTRPLSHYWIASSHNTYLTGDQFSSESSCDAYIRCLRMGCRCIELDCWDGPDGMPIVYHGHTLTTRIKFIDVIKTIKEHAFVVSDYPVILSIEDNCSLPQQRNMAIAMQEIFGSLLLTHPVEKNETVLPSPEQLKRKILLKHKKLPEGVEDDSILFTVEDVRDMDLRNTVKNGVLYLEDPVDKVWNPHFFVLTQNKLFYTDTFHSNVGEDGDDEGEAEGNASPVGPLKLREGIPHYELHFGETWFHGKLSGGRAEAESLLKSYKHLGDGTFLVRESETFIGDYSLSFWWKCKVNHCRIRSKQELGQTKYMLIDNACFDSLYSLITHYRSHPLKSQEFVITLTEPVPQPNKHEGKEWYHPNISRLDAENLLKRVPYEGAFLIRPLEKVPNPTAYVLSFRTDKNIKHCKIMMEGRLYTIGTYQFESLVELVSYYEKHLLYGKIKLRCPVGEDSGHRLPLSSDSMLLGNLQKGSLDIMGAVVELAPGNTRGLVNILRIQNPNMCTVFEAGVESHDQALEWVKAIKDTAQDASLRDVKHKEMEKSWRIAKEISTLIVYCRSVAFNIDKIKQKGFVFSEMSSFPETKAEKLIVQQEWEFFLKYHQHQFSRVYPRGQRIDSSNYNPMGLWNVGCQMVALNYQTPDKPMQLNLAKFRQNRGCGYLLKPNFMFNPLFDPHNKQSVAALKSPGFRLVVTLTVIAARHLLRAGRGMASPFVVVEVLGADYDTGIKLTTRIISDNGLNPVWNESCEFEVINPRLAMLRFSVEDEDMFGDPNFIGQATYPFCGLRTGYRSVPLKNGYSEDHELSTLLVHMKWHFPPSLPSSSSASSHLSKSSVETEATEC